MATPPEAWLKDNSSRTCPVCGALVGNAEDSKIVHSNWHAYLDETFWPTGIPIEIQAKRSCTFYYEEQPFHVNMFEAASLRSLATDDPVKANEMARDYLEREKRGE